MGRFKVAGFATDLHSTILIRHHCTALQRTATYCNTLQYTAIHCNTLQDTATHSTDTTVHCNALQHTATHNVDKAPCSRLIKNSEEVRSSKILTPQSNNHKYSRPQICFFLLSVVYTVKKARELQIKFCHKTSFGPRKSTIIWPVFAHVRKRLKISNR